MDKYGQLSTSSYFSIVLTSFILLFVYLSLSIIEIESTRSTVLVGCAVVLFTVISFVGLCHYPLSVSVDNQEVQINFILFHKKINLSDISGVRDFNDGKNIKPVLGSYGFFGWWGIYTHRDIGTFRLTASSLENLVVLKLKNGKTRVISCNNSTEMARQIELRISYI